MRTILAAAAVIFLLSSPQAEAQLSYEIAFSSLAFTQPVAIEHAPDGNDWLYVVEQPGQIMVFENDPQVTSMSTFLDIRARVSNANWEEGLLGLAFHPEYEENGYFFVYYSAAGPRRSVLSRFERSADDPMAADPDSELILLQFNQPAGNHNGGDLTFGADGYLYVSSGDGGFGSASNAQNTGNVLGTILRLDVDGGGEPPDCGGPQANYTVPDNLLADGPGGVCDEIYAYGLRNPWRISFDSETGMFWVGDVGAATWEEVNIVNDGDNLAWPVMEGNACFSNVPGAPPCNDPSFIGPIWVYGFAGSQSITGGFVYRGERAPELYGRYVYADFISGQIWALDYTGLGPAKNEQLFNSPLRISTFGLDMHGHLYFAHRPEGPGGGRIYTFRSASIGTDGGEVRREMDLRLTGPNPFRTGTSLAFQTAEPGAARVAVYDLLGREVAVLFDAHSEGSSTEVALPAGSLAAGTYVVRLTVDGLPVASERVTVVR